MQNPKLTAIATKAADDLRALVSEAEDKILEAWDRCETEAQDNETAPKFRFALTVTLDLDKDTMQTDLTFGVRHKLTAQAQIPDPTQGKLELAE